MELIAKLVELLPVQTGTNKKGKWKKQDFIVETHEPNKRTVCLSCWDDSIRMNEFKKDEILKINFRIETKEYNHKWNTYVTAFRAERSVNEVQKEISFTSKIETIMPERTKILEAGTSPKKFEEIFHRELFLVRDVNSGKLILLNGRHLLPKEKGIKIGDILIFSVHIQSELNYGWKTRVFIDEVK